MVKNSFASRNQPSAITSSNIGFNLITVKRAVVTQAKFFSYILAVTHQIKISVFDFAGNFGNVTGLIGDMQFNKMWQSRWRDTNVYFGLIRI
jgi:hypothetical protein